VCENIHKNRQNSFRHQILISSIRKLQGTSLEHYKKRKYDLKIFFKRIFQLVGIHIRTVSFDNLALFIHDELGEVPFYEITQQTTLLFLQICPKRMRVITVHVDFLEQVEFYLWKILDKSCSFNEKSRRLLPALQYEFLIFLSSSIIQR